LARPARHVRAEELSFDSTIAAKYLGDVAVALRRAVRLGSLRIELLRRGQIALNRDEAPSEKAAGISRQRGLDCAPLRR